MSSQTDPNRDESRDKSRDNKQSKAASVLGDYDDVLIENHEYDGIREYDNPMPSWWTWLFIVTVIWAAVYFVAINMGYINTYEEDLAEGQAEITKLRDQNQMNNPAVDAQMLAAASDDAAQVSEGEAVYKSTCASCHGQKGEGLIGPNLTDQYWLHGGSHMDIYKVVAEGVTANGMPAWEGVINQDEMVAVVAYIDSIEGTDPPNAKEPQGDKVEGGS
jgi:cytochrome c oxidase cbb3-type subunit 3